MSGRPAGQRCTAHQASQPADVEVSWSVVDGPTVESAVNKLDWHDGDVIMVGSSRLAQARRLFLGSTAAKMLHELPIPMIVVPRTRAQEGAQR